jgi:hypothetical protein
MPKLILLMVLAASLAGCGALGAARQVAGSRAEKVECHYQRDGMAYSLECQVSGHVDASTPSALDWLAQ